MNDITQSKVERFAEWLLRAGRVDGTGGLAVKSVRDILSVFRLSLQFADEHGTSVAHIPHVKIAENEKKKIEILTREEEQRLLKYIAAVTDSQKLGVILSLCTGLRIGELCALTWEDIDLNAEVIYVRHTLLRISDPEQMDSKTKILIGSPKTRSSERQIPIPKFLLPMLWEQRCVIQESRSYVLTGTLHYIEPSNYYAKYQRWLKKCNVRPHSFHALRHTFATNCIENGFDVKSLSEILGHADVRITLNRYVHPSMELKRKNMERLSELYSSQKISQ